jgi:outer membrane protein
MRCRTRVLCLALYVSGLAHAGACPEAQPAALTVLAVLARGLCLDPRLDQQGAELSRTRAAIDESRAASAWQLSLQAVPSLSSQTGSGGGTRTVSAAGTLAASRVLADGGLTGSRTTQREREAAASVADAEAARQDVLRELAGVWADAREAQAVLSAAKRALDAAREADAAAQARLLAGTTTRVDTLAAASTKAQAEREELTADLGWRQRKAILAERMGWPAETAITLHHSEDELLSRMSDAIGASTPSAPLESHPQLQAQRERIGARRAGLEATRAEERPTLSLGGNAGPYVGRTDIGSPARHETRQQWKQEVALTWSLPLSDGGARQSRTAQSLASLDGSLAAAATLERNLREALWQQWTAWRSADGEVGAARAALMAAQEAEAAQRGRYQAGAGTLADWITAQSDLAARMRQDATAEQARVRAAVGTAHALGRLTLDLQP